MSREEDLEFLKNLQEELKTQDRDSQASPRFWVVRQWEKEVTHSDFSEGQLIVIFDGDYSEFDDESDIGDFIDFMENHHEKEWDCIKDKKFYEDMSDIIEVLEEECFDGFTIYDYKKVPVIKENTMFLTKQEAREHIEANYYHYNKSAHTYAMTAWRAPKVQKVLEILENFDFKEVQNG